MYNLALSPGSTHVTRWTYNTEKLGVAWGRGYVQPATYHKHYTQQCKHRLEIQLKNTEMYVAKDKDKSVIAKHAYMTTTQSAEMQWASWITELYHNKELLSIHKNQRMIFQQR